MKEKREISLIKRSFGRNQFKVNFTLIHELFSSIIYIYIFGHKTGKKNAKQRKRQRRRRRRQWSNEGKAKNGALQRPETGDMQTNEFIYYTGQTVENSRNTTFIAQSFECNRFFSTHTHVFSLSLSFFTRFVFSSEFNKDPHAFRSSIPKLAHTNWKPEYYKQCNEKRRLKCDK